ncbi:peptidyl-tRNA hydrolase [Patescibacteria group bacterium]|nr:peptidyl-tRNA hydrolase [Patescibacteria group bacterium]
MFLIVGLGNPGKKFQNTRHNIGRLVINSWQLASRFLDFRIEKRLNALISKGVLDKKQIILALPETFMNNSGKAVKSLTTRYPPEARLAKGGKIPARGETPAVGEIRQGRRQRRQNTSLIVVHDDIDLPLGTVRISIDRGSAGHKGVESIIKELGTKNFIRVRIGICPQDFKPKGVDKFVLEKFNKKEEGKIKEIIKKSFLVIEMIIKEGIEKARQKYNQ